MSFSTIMFFVVGRQILISNEKEAIAAQQEFERLATKQLREEEAENEDYKIIKKKEAEQKLKDDRAEERQEILEKKMEDAEAAVLRSMEAYEIKCDQELNG